jgi:hypothetical protein
MLQSWLEGLSDPKKMDGGGEKYAQRGRGRGRGRNRREEGGRRAVKDLEGDGGGDSVDELESLAGGLDRIAEAPPPDDLLPFSWVVFVNIFLAAASRPVVILC